MKPTKDRDWIDRNGTDQVDIANTSYENLPPDWQAENKAAAEIVVDILLSRDGHLDLKDEASRIQVGSQVHSAWLERNDWARGGELDVPFDQLSEAEQAKDISQIEVAQRVFGL
jgi:hypothetical protein